MKLRSKFYILTLLVTLNLSQANAENCALSSAPNGLNFFQDFVDVQTEGEPIRLPEIEEEMVKLINQSRKDANSGNPLTRHPVIDEMAHAHTLDAAQSLVNHNVWIAHSSEDPEKADLLDRLKAAQTLVESTSSEKTVFQSVGENIMRKYSTAELLQPTGQFSLKSLAKMLHEDFLGSPHHKENLLDPSWKYVGIHVVKIVLPPKNGLKQKYPYQYLVTVNFGY